jgi:hypothetical protein
MNIFNRHKKKQENLQYNQVLSKEGISEDKNKDGIPDYLQRENYASIINSNKDFLKWESDVETEIEQHIMGLKGYDYDANKNLWIPVSPPLINNFGINFIKAYLRTVINKHSINTSFSEDDAHKICLFHSTALVRTLKYRKNIYDINLADLDAIVIGIDNLCEIVLSRSVGDKQRLHNDNRLNMNYNGSVESGRF